MKQAHLTAPKTLAWHEAPTPQPGPGELLVRIRAALTCGTDLKTYRRGHPKLQFGPFGHEAAGDVVAVGESVTNFVPGDPVMWVQTAPCGECARCMDGRENLCERLFDEMALGAYADFLLLPRKVVARNVFHKPENLSYIEAAFLEPLSCVVHGWNVLQNANSAYPLPRALAVVGTGTIGLLHVAYAAQLGVSITAIGRHAERLALARVLGAAETVDAGQDDVRAQPTASFDAVIECAGTEQAWHHAVSLAKPGGCVLLFSGLSSDTQVTLDAARLHYEEVACVGAFHFRPADVRQARDLLAGGAIDVRRLVSGVEPLTALADVFERLDRRAGYKYALVPDGQSSDWV